MKTKDKDKIENTKKKEKHEKWEKERKIAFGFLSCIEVLILTGLLIVSCRLLYPIIYMMFIYTGWKLFIGFIVSIFSILLISFLVYLIFNTIKNFWIVEN